MKTLGCDLCDDEFTADEYQGWLQLLTIHCQKIHPDFLESFQKKPEATKEQWHLEMQARFERADKYSYNQKPKTKFSTEIENIKEKILNSPVSIFCGRNNSGKSYLLKQLTVSLDEKASYIGPARYYNFTTLGTYSPINRNQRKTQQRQNFVSSFYRTDTNLDNSPINLQGSITEMSDQKRQKLFEIVKELLGSNISDEQIDPENRMSQRYVAADGYNISYTSSGYRLIVTILTCLLDDDYETILIDEPELGISPEAQTVLANFIFDEEQRKKYFPHLKNVVIATHSTIFLDRRNIENNYVCSKNGNEIQIDQVRTLADINRLHFFLLGNRIEALYLPSVIIITEGPTDEKYLRSVLDNKFSKLKYSVFKAESGDIQKMVYYAKQILGDIEHSPYKDRLFVVMDQKHSVDVSKLEKAGMPKENIVVWDKNGIEYYYPEELMNEVLGTTHFSIEDDIVSSKTISLKKTELAEKIVSKMRPGLKYSAEFEEKLLNKLIKL
jgi:predicted ATP-dependent endonuclease of OLD family